MTSMRFPLIPTLVVLGAVAVMIALGFWQLGRAEEKDALIARYSAASRQDAPAAFPTGAAEAERNLYRRSRLVCADVLAIQGGAGTSAGGAKGWAHQATCRTADGNRAQVALGFSQNPRSPTWAGGPVQGIVAPGPRLVADPPVAGLEPLAKPDPGDLPNNHLAYAGQWFFFAAIALVVYVLALRQRQSRG